MTAAKNYDETSINALGEGPPPYGTDSIETILQSSTLVFFFMWAK